MCVEGGSSGVQLSGRLRVEARAAPLQERKSSDEPVIGDRTCSPLSSAADGTDGEGEEGEAPGAAGRGLRAQDSMRLRRRATALHVDMSSR